MLIRSIAFSALALGASFGGAAAAPFDYSRQVFSDRAFVDVDYTLDARTLLTDINQPFSYYGEAGLAGFTLDGTLDAGAGAGFLTLSTAADGPREVYSVDIRGNIGQDYFDGSFDAAVAEGAFIGVPVPDFRLFLRPLGGRDLVALFPNGFSIRTTCRTVPASCDPTEIGPVSIGFSTGDPDFPTGYLFQNGPLELTTIPVPGALGLAALALVSLGWVGRRRQV